MAERVGSAEVSSGASRFGMVRRGRRAEIRRSVRRNWDLYIVVALPVIYIIVFAYIPMYGAQIAFKDFIATKGIMGSPWIGFKHFRDFFRSYYFLRTLKNTLGVSLYGLLAGFPFPIILAVLLNEIGSPVYKKSVQMITYMPYFISTVVLVSMLMQALDLRIGVVNNVLKLVGIAPVHFMAKPELFKSIYVWSDIWQGAGYGSIIYLAALSSVDPALYEAATVDGATKLQRIRLIDIPTILPTVVILFILNMGGMMSVGFEKVYLLQNPLNLSSSEVIATYVYKVGLLGGNFSFSTAVGFFNSVVNCLLLVLFNALAKRIGQASLW
jgi:putative aldouronate transport system permease protein